MNSEIQSLNLRVWALRLSFIPSDFQRNKTHNELDLKPSREGEGKRHLTKGIYAPPRRADQKMNNALLYVEVKHYNLQLLDFEQDVIPYTRTAVFLCTAGGISFFLQLRCIM